jgi:hypothetical protein
MSGQAVGTYRCAPRVAWVQDAAQTLLVDRQDDRCWTLTGIEAAIWDLLTLGYASEQAVRFLSLFKSIPTEDARPALLTILQGWERAGLVQASGGNGDG